MSGAEDLDALLRKYCSGSSEYNMLNDTYAGALHTALRRCPPALPRVASLPALTICSSCLPLPSELYAIIKTVEKLERHYVRGTIEAKDYEPACQRLIAQFKTNYDPIRTTVRGSTCARSTCIHLELPACQNKRAIIQTIIGRRSPPLRPLASSAPHCRLCRVLRFPTWRPSWTPTA